MAANSTSKPRRRKTASDKPKKPYPAFPLTPHACGKWQKKIRGKIHYFGRWNRTRNGNKERLPGDGWKEALEIYKAQADDLHAGRTPRKVKDGELTLADLCNRFLTAKLNKLKSGELTPRTLSEYRHTTDRLIVFFGKTRLVEDLDASDFQTLRADIADGVGPVRLSNEITRCKSVFKYAAENKLIPQPVMFGTEFNKPDKSVMRRHRAKSDKKLFTDNEIRSLLEVASLQLKAAILLGINAGAGNMDVGSLEHSHLDLKGGWLNYPRGKTGIGRRCPLWPETVEALEQAIANRPEPKDKKADKNVILLTARGIRFVRNTEKSRTDDITRGFSKLLRQLKINDRKFLGFYSLRHTFATVGLQTKDRDAVKSLMGHAQSDILSLYDESGPSDDRLRAVTDHVRAWLFAEEGAK